MTSSKRRQKSRSAKFGDKAFRAAVFSLPDKPPLEKMDRAIKSKWLNMLASPHIYECYGVLSKAVKMGGATVYAYDPFGVLCLVYRKEASRLKMPALLEPALRAEVIPSFIREWAGISESHRSCLEEIHDRWFQSQGQKKFGFAIEYIKRFM